MDSQHSDTVGSLVKRPAAERDLDLKYLGASLSGIRFDD